MVVVVVIVVVAEWGCVCLQGSVMQFDIFGGKWLNWNYYNAVIILLKYCFSAAIVGFRQCWISYFSNVSLILLRLQVTALKIIRYYYH